MMEEFFEILKREGLDSDEGIERAVLHDWTVGGIAELNARLFEAIEESASWSTADLGSFAFVPNSELSAHHGTCVHWDCRLGRADRLARFAALWADAVLIPSYFTPEAEVTSQAEEAWFRQWVAGDLKLVVALKPLLEMGIVILFNPEFILCADCGRLFAAELDRADAAAAKAKAAVHSAYRDRAEVRFTFRPQLPENRRFQVGIRAPEDLIHHGGHILVSGRAPDWLPRAIRAKVDRRVPVEYQVPRSRIERTGMLSHEIDMVVDDIVLQHLLSVLAGTKYLTDRHVDAVFLDAVNENPEYARWTAVLTQHLQYQLPIIESVPVEHLLEVRRTEHDAFLVYRDTLKRLIEEHIAGKPAISGDEAREIYQDVVEPSLNKLNAKVHSIRGALSDRLRVTVPVTTTALAVGLFGGLLPPAAGELLATCGGLGLFHEAVSALVSRAAPPEELRNDNFYFLWKAAHITNPPGTAPRR